MDLAEMLASSLCALAMLLVVQWLRSHPTPVGKSRSDKDAAQDLVVREKSRTAAIDRAKKSVPWQPPKTEKTENQMVKKKKRAFLADERQGKSSFGSTKPTSSTNSNQPLGTLHPHTSNGFGILAEEGLTRYYCIPGLHHSEQVAAMMKQLAKEFAPIIKRRGYQLYSVSELCCCGDGLDMNELGGHGKRVKAGQKISGVEQHECSGYNSTKLGRRGQWKTRHTIHLRVRNVKNHNIILPYGNLVDTMCHELAHCIHHGGHPPAFYDLMDEIKQEYLSVVNGTHRDEYGIVDEFDIYASSAGMRC